MTVLVPELPRATVAPTPCPRWQTLLVTMVLAIVVYLPAALGSSLLAFDDNFFFGPDNPEFRDGLAAVLDPSRPIANAWLPVAHASLWLDWAWSGAAPFWPHLHALLLHGIAGFVLVRLLLQLGVARGVAHAAGALFVVHPALAESVAWVSGRKDLLCGVFVFAALHQTAVFARAPSRWRAFGLLLLAALAMYSKATAVVLPLLALLVACHAGGARARWLAPAVLLAAVLPIAWHHQVIAAEQGTLAAGDAGERLWQVPGAFLHYVTTSAWPLQLNVLYPEVDTLARFRGDCGLGAAVLAAWCAAAVLAWWRRSWRLLGLGLAGFVTALLPFNTAFPASSIAAADRYLYLAVPWFALALAALAARLVPPRPPWLFTALLAALALPLAWLAGGRAHAFTDDETLWRSSLGTEPVNAVAHLNLIAAIQLHTRPEEVRRLYEAAALAARYPIHEAEARRALARFAIHDADYPRAAHEALRVVACLELELATAASDKRRVEATVLLLGAQLAAFEPFQLAGDDDGAVRMLSAARALAPAHPDVIAFSALRDLSACRDELLAKAKAGKAPHLAVDDARCIAADTALAAAQAEWRQRLDREARGQVEPRPHAGLALAQAEWCRARDQVMAALRHYEEALRSDPNCMQAWLGASRLLREKELWEGAEKKARAGLARRPDPALRQELALALVGQGRLGDAELQLEAYMRARPHDKDTAKVLANVLVGRAYANLSDSADRAEVKRLVERALAYNANEPKAHYVLGRIAKDEQRLDDAVRLLAIAHRHLPDFEEAREAYAGALAALGYDRLLRRDDDGAVDAWLRCVAVAPPDFDSSPIRGQLQRAWERTEAAGVKRLQAGDRQGAVAAFRRCLQIAPDQHWAAWLLAQALQDDPAADLAEVEQLCRRAVSWQEQHGLEKSRQVLLLASTLVRAGKAADGKAVASEYLRAPESDAKPQVLAALQRLAEG